MHFRFHEIFLSFFVLVISSEINWYCFWLSQKVIIKRWHLWIFTLFTGLLRFTTFLFLLDQIVFNTCTYNENKLSSLMNLVKTSIISVRTSQMKFGLIFTHWYDKTFQVDYSLVKMRMLLQKRFQPIVVFHREKSRSGLPAVARCPFLCMFTCLWVSETLKKLLSGSFRVEGKHNTMSRRHDTAKYIKENPHQS